MLTRRFDVVGSVVSWVVRCALLLSCASLAACFGTSESGLTPSGDGGAADGSPASSASFSVDAVVHDFGAGVVGSVSAPAAVVLTNSGTATSGVIATNVSDVDATSFAVVTDDCTGKTLAPSARCSVTLRFKPAGEGGAKSATLSMSATPGGATATKLTGTLLTAGALSMSPGVKDFGATPQGTSTATALFTLKNTGGSTTSLLAVNVTGTDRTQFAVSADTCSGTSLAAGASCTLSVAFTPGALGLKSASLVATATEGGSATAAITGTGIAPGSLSLLPAAQDFAGIVVGASSADKTFTVKNSGGAPTGVPSFALSGADAQDFQTGSNTCTAALAAGATCTVSMRFSPTTSGAKTATLTVIASPGGSASTALSGIGLTAAALSIAPSTRDFGSIVLGTPSADVAFTVTNSGGVASGVPAVSITGANAAEFLVTSNGCTSALAPNATCVVRARFAPTQVGSRSATLQVSATPGGTVTSTLQGSGLTQGALSLSPSSHAFGSWLVNTPSADFDFTISNTGGVPTGVPAIALSGSDAAEFVIVSNACTAVVNPGASCAVRVHFLPTTPGAKSASLGVTATPGGSGIASLSGTGLGPALLRMVPGTQDFGSVVDGATSSDVVFTISNSGGVASGALSVALTGANASEFAVVASGCAAALAPAATCSVTVRFSPIAAGAKAASLDVSATPGGTASATLSGNGLTPAQLSLAPSAHDYGAVVIGASSGDFVFTISNTGAVPSGVPSVALGGANAGDFVITVNGCTAALPSGASCTVTAQLRPTTAGARTATLTVAATPGGTVSASLTGTGLTPGALSISPTPHDFGSAVVGAVGTDVPFTVTNTGGGSTGVPSVTLTGADASQFVATSGCTAALVGGATCTINVHFAPTTPGAKVGALSVSAAPGGTAVAQLSGTALADALLAVAPAPFGFGGEVVATSTSDVTFTVSNSGGVASGAPTVAIIGPNAADFVLTTNGCTSAIAPGTSCLLAIHFTPATTGARSATLSVTASPGGTATSALSGTGLAPASLTIAPSPFDYGTVITGASTTRAFVVTNGGGVASGAPSVALGGSDATQFVVSSNGCTAAIPSGATCTLSVDFRPTTAGAKTAQISVSATPGGTATALIGGNAVTPALLQLTPASNDYGAVTLNATSDFSFTITNAGGASSGAISVAFSGAGAASYSVLSSSCGAPLAPTSTCAVIVRFQPASAGSQPATLTVSATPGGAPTAALSGIGLTPASLSVGPGSHDFGTFPVGQTSSTFTFTVANSGTQSSGQPNVSLTGVDVGQFVIDSNGCVSPIANGAPCSIVLHFAPNQSGVKTATLAISAAPGGTASASLTGTAP